MIDKLNKLPILTAIGGLFGIMFGAVNVFLPELFVDDVWFLLFVGAGIITMFFPIAKLIFYNLCGKSKQGRKARN